MNAVGKLSTYISQGVNTFAGPFHPFGGAIDIIAVQQQDGSFKSTPWNVKFGKFQGVLKHREKLVDVAVNDVDADFHMYLDHTGEAYFLEDADSDNDDNLLSLSSAPSSGEEGSSKPVAEYQTSQEVERDARPSVQDIMLTKNEGSSVSGDEGSKVRDSSKEDAPDFSLENCLDPDEKVSDLANAKLLLSREPILDGLDDSVCVSDLESVNIRKGVLKVTKVSNEEATKVSSEELTSTRDAIRVHSEAPDENGAHNRERMHSTLNNAVGLEECRVSGPASALIADNVLTSFVNVASSSDQLSGGLNRASTPSQISMSESFTPVVGLESLTVVEAMKTNFVVSDSSEVNKTPADEENVYAGSKFVAESYSGDPSGISLASAVVQLQDDVEGNAKAENIKTSDTREFLSDSGAAFCHEPLNMEREIVSEEKGGTNLENASAENKTDVRDIELPEKTIVLPEDSKKEEELSADGKTISEGALVVTDNICAQGNSAGSISRPIRNTHRETAVEQEIAWRKVLENAARAMKSVPIAASLEMETNLKATDAKDSGTLADSLEKRSWGWWSWRGSVEKKQMNDRRSARISRKLSGRNSKAMEVSPNDSKSAEAHVEVKDSTTELMSGIINHQVGFHVSCTSNADTSTEVEAKKDMLTQQPGLSNHQGSFSEEGRVLLERGKETASLSREISKGTSQFETTSELREMESPKSGLKPSRSILSFVFGGSGRAQNPTGLQEHAALPLENTGIQKEQHKEVLVETAEIITELLDRKWSTGKRRSSQIVDKNTRRHSLSSSPQVECGQSFKHMTPINVERDSNAKVDELFYTPLDKTTLDSDTGEKENQFVRGALLLKETKLAQMQGQSELSSCILDEITVEGEHELPHSLNKLSATSSCHEDLLLGSTMSGVNSFPAEANQVQRNNYSETCEQMDFADQSTEQVIPIGHLSEVGVGNRDDFVVKTSSNFHNKSLKSFERAQHLLQQGDLSDDEGNLGDQSTSKSTDPKVGLDKGSRSDCTFLETEVTEGVRGGFHLSPSAGSRVAEPERASADEQSISKNVDTTYLHNLKSSKRCDIPVDEEIGDSIGQFEVDKNAGLMDKGDERIDVRNDNDSDSQVPPYDTELRGVTRCTDLCLPCAANSATSPLAADCPADVALGFSNKTEEKLLSLRSRRYLSFKDVEEYYEPLDSPVNADTEVTEDVFKSCLVLPDLLSPSGEDDDEETGYKAQDLQPVPDLGTSDDDEENGYKAEDLQPVPDLGTSDELYIPLPKDQKPLKVGCNDSIHAKLLSTPIDVPNEAKNYFKWHTVRQLSESMPVFTSKAIDVREASAQKVLSCSLGTLSLQNDHHESLELAFASGRTGLALTANTHLIKLGELANDSEVNLEQEGSKALESPKQNTSPSVFSLPELLPASDQIDTLPMAPVGGKLSSTVTQVNNSDTGFELSLCKHLLTKRMGREAADKAFNSEKVSLESFRSSGASIVGNEKLVVRVGGKYYPWTVAAPLIVGMLTFGQFVVPPNTEGEIVVEVPTAVNYSKTVLNTSTSSAGAWRLWPFLLRRSKTPETLSAKSTLSREALLVASKLALQGPLAKDFLHLNGYYSHPLHRHRIRTQVPTSKQLASLNLKGGKNKITFTFFTSVLGRQQVDAHIYLWKWNARIVISDVDGTITRSDVLGQVMPLVGKDWTQTGVTRLFSAIKENGYELMFLSARAISQAYLTRQFLLNLKQDGEPLPDGPVVISPDGLFPSLYREVIRRAPHEFKIACLQDVRALFPSECNPFYAGFGNRDTDEISYLKVGIPRGKIFIINPKGEVIVNNLASVKTYTSLHKLVNDMFPPVTYTEQEDFNSWNFWKMPLPEIEDETNMKSSKIVISKGADDLKKITKS